MRLDLSVCEHFRCFEKAEFLFWRILFLFQKPLRFTDKLMRIGEVLLGPLVLPVFFADLDKLVEVEVELISEVFLRLFQVFKRND